MVNKSYLEWKDEKTKPFRMTWLDSVQKYEQQTDRYYELHERYSRGEVDYDQLSNAYNDMDRARLSVEKSAAIYFGASRRFDLKMYFQDQREAAE